jgi:hypothetical protein
MRVRATGGTIYTRRASEVRSLVLQRWIEAEHTVGWGCLQGGTDTNSYIYIDEMAKVYIYVCK